MSLAMKSGRRDLVLGISVGLLCLATRLPWASHMLYNSDSTRLALAVEHFDVSQMRPHAPGYILYVALGKLADLVIHDPGTSLVAVSILSTALAAVVLYFLGLRMFSRSTAFVSAMLLWSSPLVWFNGEMAFTYTLETFLSLAFAYACFRALSGGRWGLPASALFLGLATGARQNMILFLFPLWIFVLRKYGFKRILGSICIFACTSLAWLIPLVVLSGGWKTYFGVLRAQVATVVVPAVSFLTQIQIRGRFLASFLLYSLVLGLGPLLYFFGRFLRGGTAFRDARYTFLGLWILPAALFFIGVNLYNPGQVMVILPPLFLLAAEGINRFTEVIGGNARKVGARAAARADLPGRGRRIQRAVFVASVIVLLAVNIFVFLFLEIPVSAASIKEGERRLSELVRLTREHFAPENVLILACRLNTQAGYYLPEYRIICPFPLIFSGDEIPIGSQNVYVSFGRQTEPKTYWMDTGFKIEPLSFPEGVETLILWEEEVAGYYEDRERPLREIASSAGGAKIYAFQVKPGEKIHYGYHFLSIR
jgi:4-amino-4-deoxy-L-arabinose transferase-like glycosyltransferase